jgi:hypothetical protein
MIAPAPPLVPSLLAQAGLTFSVVAFLVGLLALAVVLASAVVALVATAAGIRARRRRDRAAGRWILWTGTAAFLPPLAFAALGLALSVRAQGRNATTVALATLFVAASAGLAALLFEAQRHRRVRRRGTSVANEGSRMVMGLPTAGVRRAGSRCRR